MKLLEILKAKFWDWSDGSAVIEAVHVLSEFHFHTDSNKRTTQHPVSDSRPRGTDSKKKELFKNHIVEHFQFCWLDLEYAAL